MSNELKNAIFQTAKDYGINCGKVEVDFNVKHDNFKATIHEFKKQSVGNETISVRITKDLNR